MMPSWPHEYVNFDGGGLLVHPEYVELFEARGWTTVAALLQGTWTAEVMRHREGPSGWDNLRLSLPAPSDPRAEATVYMKRHKLPGPGRHEADAAGWCQQAGVTSFQVIAAGQTAEPVTGPSGSTFSSLFLSAGVGTGRNVYDVIEEAACGEASERAGSMESILAQVARAAARLHSAGLFHGDIHFNNLLVETELATGNPAVRLIDLQGLRSCEKESEARYYWLKDMGQLRQSLIRAEVMGELGEFWLEQYWAAVDSPRVQSWNTLWNQRLISLRADARLAKRVVRRLAELRFRDASRMLQRRFRAA